MTERNVVGEIEVEFNKMGLDDSKKLKLDTIRSKDGVHLFRVNYNGTSYVLKYFSNNDDAREILNYSTLKSLGIPTIKVIAATESSLLLEDISHSNIYRLGISDDLDDPEVARLIARWYQSLHDEGERYLKTEETVLYRETDIITEENIVMIKDKSGTADNLVWPFIIGNFQVIRDVMAGLKETLTYNDFYWTNLIVGRDKTAALMFDYNLLGIGYRFGDIRNVCSALSERCKAVFLEEYGGYDKKEKVMDAGIATLVNLVFAFQKTSFPSWGEGSLEQVKNGELYKAIMKIVQVYGRVSMS